MDILSQSITASDVYSSAADTLAALLPPALKAECDKFLGENVESKERWTIYQTAYTHYQHRETTK